jgi:hypothetical protein
MGTYTTIPANDLLVAAANPYAVPYANARRRLADLKRQIAATARMLRVAEQHVAQHAAKGRPAPATRSRAALLSENVARLWADYAQAEHAAAQLAALKNAADR